MKQQTDVMAFLIELIKRFSLKSPKFFQVIQAVGLIAGLITGVPEFLQLLGMQLPAAIAPFASKTIAAASSVLWIMAKLPVDPKAMLESKMPFTTKNQRVINKKPNQQTL